REAEVVAPVGVDAQPVRAVGHPEGRHPGRGAAGPGVVPAGQPGLLGEGERAVGLGHVQRTPLTKATAKPPATASTAPTGNNGAYPPARPTMPPASSGPQVCGRLKARLMTPRSLP